MLTPQEVGDKAFQKSAFGGYNMTQVDEFLDVLTADYGALYTENAVLKSKMKILVDTVEEYRSTEEAMRKALMSAQRMADEMLRGAEEQKKGMLEEAESLARARVSSIREERSVEEFRLAEAQRAVQQFSAQARATYQRGLEFLDHLGELCPAPEPSPEELVDETAVEIEENVQRILDQAMADVAADLEEEVQEETQEEPAQTAPAEILEDEDELDDEDDDVTLDFSGLDFGRDYQIK